MRKIQIFVFGLKTKARMLKMVRQAHHPTGKRAQKRWKMTTNVDKVRTNEGYFKTRFARDAQKNTEFKVQRPEFRVQKTISLSPPTNRHL